MIKYVFIVIAIIGLFSCSKPVKETSAPVDSVIVEKKVETLKVPPSPINNKRNPLGSGILKVLSLHSINSFFVLNGQPLGIEYEILQQYCNHKKLRLEIVAVHHYAELYDSLETGNYDIVIGTLVDAKGWKQNLLSSNSIYKSDLLVVALDSAHLNDSIRVIKNSPVAFWREENDSTKAVPFKFIEETTSKEQGLALVANNIYPNILVDKNEYEIMRAFFPQLNTVRVIHSEADVVFLFHPALNKLRDDFNAWFHPWRTKKGDYGWIFKKYRAMLDANRKKMSVEKPDLLLNKISRYDKLVKDYSQLHGFDWLFVSALIYQESRFHPEIESPVGARGLMQLMPSVATTYKVDFRRLKDPRRNIELGTKYLRRLYNYFDKDSTLTVENKLKFTLASYNAGLGHVIDARALARKHKYDPNIWDNHVAVMLTKKHLREFNHDPVVKYGHFRGWETYGYVQNIMVYYNHYQNHMEKYFEVKK